MHIHHLTPVRDNTSEMVLCPILWGMNYHVFMPMRLDEISNLKGDNHLKFVHANQFFFGTVTPTYLLCQLL